MCDHFHTRSDNVKVVLIPLVNEDIDPFHLRVLLTSQKSREVRRLERARRQPVGKEQSDRYREVSRESDHHL